MRISSPGIIGFLAQHTRTRHVDGGAQVSSPLAGERRLPLHTSSRLRTHEEGYVEGGGDDVDTTE